jgi:hypothetical protein
MDSGKSKGRGRSKSVKPAASRAASKARSKSRSKAANAPAMNAAAMMKQIANLQAALQKMTVATNKVANLPASPAANAAPGTSKRAKYEKSVKNVMAELGLAYRNAQKVVAERKNATKKSKPMPKGALNTMNLARTLRAANPNMKWTNAMKAASVQRKGANTLKLSPAVATNPGVKRVGPKTTKTD